MNKTQIQTLLAPIIGVLVTWLASKFPLLDHDTWSTLINTLVSSGVLAFIAIITRKKALADTVATGGTVVVAPPEIAHGLPNNPDVVSSADNKVVSR